MSIYIDILRAISGAIITPPLVFVLIVIGIILNQKNKKIVVMQKMILGGSVNSSIELTLSQLVLGVIGGTIGSIILTSLGVVFSKVSGITYLILISMLLMFIKPRLICFSYSGAVLGILSIFIKIISLFIPELSNIKIFNIDILYLMIFVGVFHIIEGFLVMIDGDRGAVPVFTNKDGRILGGYVFKRYWALPISVMIAASFNNLTSSYPTISIQGSQWWALMKSPAFNIIDTIMISIFPMYAMLGYSTVTFTLTKKEKVKSSGMYILTYGLILTIIAQIARIGLWGELIVVIFAPFAHEFMLKIQTKNEEKRCAKFVSDEEGLVVLEIAPDSPVKDFEIDIGSKILSINNIRIDSESEVYSILKENLYNVNLKVKDSKGVIKEIKFKHNKNKRLGILLVPRNVDKQDIVSVSDESFNNILNALKDAKNINCEKDKEINNKK